MINPWHKREINSCRWISKPKLNDECDVSVSSEMGITCRAYEMEEIATIEAGRVENDNGKKDM